MRVGSFAERVLTVAVTVLLVFGGGSLVHAQSAGASDDPSPHSEAALVTEVASVTPGEPFTAALRLQMEDGWHSYWKNPGDSGKSTAINWALPDGFDVGSLQWPYPHRIEIAGVASYGYSDEVLLPVRITPPDTLSPGTSVSLEGRATWLICADICLPARADVELTLPVTEEAPAPSEAAEAIAAARTRVPTPVGGWTARAARSSGSYTLALTAETSHQPDLTGAYFFPAEKGVLDHAAPQPVSRRGDTHLIALQESEYAQGSADSLRGLLLAPEGTTWDPGGKHRAMKIHVPVDSTLPDVTAATAGPSSGGGGLSLPWALLFAFAGGVLLNLMPCVFPVLSVKILGFARDVDEDPTAIRRRGGLFGAGVLVSMWIVAGVLLGLRAAGSQIGWGFQLQSPTFVALMTLLFFGIGLNLLGAFELGTRLMSWGGQLERETSSASDSGAFLTGVLATVVATPCTAPFMGAALGVALTLSATGALLIFTALGVGMAAPYVGLSMAPRLLEPLPEPGAWMETLKQFFAFPMFATAIWLVWVFGQQTSTGGVALLLGGLLLLGLAVWIVHRWSAPARSRGVRVVTRGLAAAMLFGAVASAVIGADAGGASASTAAASPEESVPPSSASASAEWASFDPARIEELRREGRPVFIDFTAAWCLTCQVNKQTVLTSDAVMSAFDQHNVALVRADWTNRDPEITKALESHGRSGVPVYVLYSGDGSEPTLLPEVLTEDIVIDALETAAPSPAS